MNTDHTFSWFCALIQSALWGKAVRYPATPPDWEKLLKLARSQTMLGILFDGIEMLPKEMRPPRLIYIQWAASVAQIEEGNKRLNEKVAELCQSYRKAGVSPVLLKGQGVATLYPHPEHRQCGDIDIYTGLKGYPLANRMLLQQNAVPHGEESAKHASFVLNNVHIENHRIVSKLYNPVANRHFQKMVKAWYPAEAETVCIHDTLVAVPPCTFNAVYIFVHSFMHFLNSGIGLRQLCDWSRLLYVKHDTIDRREMIVHLKRLGLLRAAQAFGYVAHHYIGLPEDRLPFSIKEVAEEGEYLLKEILATGNFGKYDSRIKPRPKGYWSGKWHTFSRATKRCLNLARFAPTEAFWYPIGLIKGTLIIQRNRFFPSGKSSKGDKAKCD